MSTETNVKQIVEISANLAQQNIAALTKPLQESFNIDSVAYVKISQQGKYQAVSNRVDMLENFFTNKIYLESPLLLQAKYKKVPHIKIWRQRDFEDPQFMRYMRFFMKVDSQLVLAFAYNTIPMLNAFILL